MPFSILDSSGQVVNVKITGELRKSELEQIQGVASEAIKHWGKIRVMVILENFLGWERGANWEDMTFALEHDNDIEKVAVVGDTRWKDHVYAFLGKGFRPVAIEYFALTELKMAQQWLV
jgi:stage II sporulation SpoAA-like protein